MATDWTPMDPCVTFSVELDLSDPAADELAAKLGARRLPTRGLSRGRLQWREVAHKSSDPNDTTMFERALRLLLARVAPLKEQMATAAPMVQPPEVDVVMPVTPDTDSTEEYLRIPVDLLLELVDWGLHWRSMHTTSIRALNQLDPPAIESRR